MLKFRHLFTTAGATIAGGGLGLLFTLVAARLLSPSENGSYAQFVLIFNLYYILINFGLGPASTYFISSGQLSEQQIVSVNVKALGAIGAASACCTAALWFGDVGKWIEVNFKVPPVMLFMGITTGFFLLIFNQALAILVGKKSFDTVNLLNILKTLLLFPVAGLFLQVQGGEVGFAISTLITLVSVSLLGMILVARTFANKFQIKPVINRALTRSILSYGGLVYLSNVMHYGATRGLLIILSYHHAPEYVGFFSIALVLLETLLIIPGVIGQLIFPHSSNPQFDYSLIDRLMRLNVYVGFFTALIVLGIANWGVVWILGDIYKPVSTALMHLTPSIVLLAIPRILSQVLSGSGHPEYPLYAATVSLFVCGTIALWIIPSYGLAGAAWVTNFISGVTAVITLYGYTQLRRVRFRDVFLPRRADLDLVFRAFKRVFTLITIRRRW